MISEGSYDTEEKLYFWAFISKKNKINKLTNYDLI